VWDLLVLLLLIFPYNPPQKIEANEDYCKAQVRIATLFHIQTGGGYFTATLRSNFWEMLDAPDENEIDQFPVCWSLLEERLKLNLEHDLYLCANRFNKGKDYDYWDKRVESNIKVRQQLELLAYAFRNPNDVYNRRKALIEYKFLVGEEAYYRRWVPFAIPATHLWGE
jgi:hypothetical protein